MLFTGCSSLPKNDMFEMILPSNNRDWSPNFAILPYATFQDDIVTVSNIRNCEYVTEEDFVLRHYDEEFDLNQLEHVDFFVVPFQGKEFIAHTMLSFAFADGKHLAVSAEIRTEKGESYSPSFGINRQYEITYVVADERDVVRLRTRHRKADVYLYRTTASREKARELFLDVMTRVNKLSKYPEFYNTLTNNCTTNIVEHVNRIKPRAVPFSVGVLLPGFSDRYAYDLGLLDRSVSFEQLKSESRINDLSEAYYDSPDYSEQIRQRMRTPVKLNSEQLNETWGAVIAKQFSTRTGTSARR